jgi:RND family efflux transporter MFP subunit
MREFSTPQPHPRSTHLPKPSRSVRAAFAIALAIASGCSPESATKEQKPVELVQVDGQAFTVEQKVWPKLFKCQGSLVADETTTVGSKVAGQISSVPVDLGDVVAKDDVLVQLDSSEYVLQARQAEAQLLQARSAVGLKPDDPLEKLDTDNAPPVREARAIWDEAKKAVVRLRELASRDAVSDTDLDIAESAERVASARFSSAQNGVREKIALISVQSALRDLANQRLRETTIRAPFAGVIESRFIATGTYAQAGQALMTIARTSVLRFRGSVPERYAQQIQLGQSISLDFDLSDQQRTVSITRISPSLDPANRSLVFEANIDNADGKLRSGLFAEGLIVIEPEATATVIPLSALVRFAGVDKVWKIVNGKLIEQYVTLGRQEDDWIEIQSGVNEGDQLLLNGKDGRQGVFVDKSDS